MSRAFVNEDTQITPPMVVPRPPLPAGVPNYVRPQGLLKLQAELFDLLAAKSHAEQIQDPAARSIALVVANVQITQLEARIASAKVVEPVAKPKEVRFGTTVRFDTLIASIMQPSRTLTLVGVDEADIAAGLVPFTAPIAKALQGVKFGQATSLKTGRGLEQLIVREIS